MREWNFLTTHGEVLSIIARQPSITTSEIASVMGISKSKVRRVMADLVAEGYISKNKNGRESSYQIIPNILLSDERRREVAVLAYLESLQVIKRTAKAEKEKEAEEEAGNLVSQVMVVKRE